MKEQFTETWQEVVERWNKGETVWSPELGGLGPSYEQCIQILLFSILDKWPKDKMLPPPKLIDIEYPQEFETLTNDVAHTLDKTYGFSGAQVGAAKNVAYQFIVYGYSEMMNKLESDRLIQVSKNFPTSVA